MGPENATASVGESVCFSCSYSGTEDNPYWRIAGHEYSTNQLPPGYIPITNGICITCVRASMNNTDHLCFFTIYVGGGNFLLIESSQAYFTVQNATVTTNPLIHVFGNASNSSNCTMDELCQSPSSGMKVKQHLISAGKSSLFFNQCT